MIAPRIIAVANQKGGVGKTTTAVNLAAALAKAGTRTLLVDLDSQASATTSCGCDPRELDFDGDTMGAVLAGKTPLEEILLSIDDNLHLAPGGGSLADVEITLGREGGGQAALREALADGLGFDAIVLDCPPNLGTLTTNALVAATELLIPVQTESLAIDGIPQIIRLARQTQRRMNSNLRFLGILPTMFVARQSQDQAALAQIHDTYGEALRVFMPIPRATAYAKAVAEGRITAVSHPATAGLDVFRALAALLTERATEAAHG